MVFGVFDRLHPGHISFFEQARSHGEVVAVVARDSACEALKGKKPLQHEQIRLLSVSALDLVSRAMLGDERQGTYAVLKNYTPDVICLGYDQKSLYKDLQKKVKLGVVPKVKLVQLKPHFPKKYHSSLL